MRFILAFVFSLLPLMASGQLNDSGLYSVIPGSKEEFKGLRAFKTVLPGVLYRGGGSGGAKPMNQGQLEALCRVGFSEAGYLYPNGLNGKKTVSCRTADGESNQLSYQVYGFRPRKDRYESLKAIHDIIQNRKGPIYMHCWNGWHASGEIAALALMQFCGWSGSRAGAYWKDNVGDKGNMGRYRSIYEKHVGQFIPFEDLKISSSDQARVCP